MPIPIGKATPFGVKSKANGAWYFCKSHYFCGVRLIIDLGNTTEKAALFAEEKLWKVYKSPKLDADTLQEIIQNNLIDAWIVSSVTDAHPWLIPHLEGKARGMVFNHTTPLPLENLYTTPETLGNDRLANAVGARELFPAENILVIDAGTCIKYDFVSREGKYFGGGISPGLAMRFEAMHQFTARLPKIQYERYANPATLALTGDSTEAAMIAGGALGAVKEVQGFIDAYRERYDGLVVILTGGDAPYFDYHLKIRIFALPDLTLIGLDTVLKFNS